MYDAVALWDNCLKVIKDNISEITFNTWFLPIKPFTYQDNVFTIQVPSQFFYEYLENNFVDLLKMTLGREVGEDTILQYRILVENTTNTKVDYRTPINTIVTPKKYAKELPVIQSPFDKVVTDDFDSQLNDKYSFNTFFEGISNKLARTAGDAIVKNPGKNAFNPLFLHGPSGVGKTHLCHAIGNAIKQEMPNKRVLYVSAHLFKIQYADAGRFNTVNDFLNFYQNIDVLIIDDIQEIAGIEKTQNAFFHIFNHLHQNNKQLILTSDRSPSELKDVTDRLLTRFRWGLTAPVESPDHDLRIKILNDKVYKDGLNIPQNVIEFIAENVTDNARDLEGVIVSIMAHTIIYNKDVDLALAKRVISQAIKKIEKKKITAQVIENVVSEFFGLDVDQLKSTTRKREIVQARQIAMYLIKNYTEMSLSQIGAALGKKNHATVLHAYKIVQEQMEVDKLFRNNVSEIEKKLSR